MDPAMIKVSVLGQKPRSGGLFVIATEAGPERFLGERSAGFGERAGVYHAISIDKHQEFALAGSDARVTGYRRPTIALETQIFGAMGGGNLSHILPRRGVVHDDNFQPVATILT